MIHHVYKTSSSRASDWDGCTVGMHGANVAVRPCSTEVGHFSKVALALWSPPETAPPSMLYGLHMGGRSAPPSE